MHRNICSGLVGLLLFLFSASASGQELFVYTEPASNMPAQSVGLRLNNWLMQETDGGRLNYHLLPEVMWGVNKNLMLHAEAFLSNRKDGSGLAFEGGSAYGKYRFFTRDALHRHFRMAAYGRVSLNNADIHQDEIMINGHNSGYEGGLIFTQLLHKQALSLTVGYVHATNNAGGNEIPNGKARDGINYALSTGRLILPKKYTDYGQTNFNIMLEVLGQVLPQTGKQYLDIAPSVQFIFNSQTRVDIGYRTPLFTNMERTAASGFLFRLEHLLFNVF